ncbi:hypothetical protein [Vulcanisaeta souniana]|uniref:hypothetical protein n=1 Tax=Vulcanisaeta souniana TaxID=164452 RepID=UPI0006D27C9F|nr:hypothetical protein [Vulcanisaeta souniana]
MIKDVKISKSTQQTTENNAKDQDFIVPYLLETSQEYISNEDYEIKELKLNDYKNYYLIPKEVKYVEGANAMEPMAARSTPQTCSTCKK